MLFNTLITFFGIFVFAITEKDVYEKDLETNVSLHNFRDLHSPDLKTMGLSFLNSLYGASVVFFSHYFYYKTGVHHYSGI